MVKKKSAKIHLWSGPRNISTAMMYSFARRSDTKVYDEPLYGHYLVQTDARNYHPGAQEIIRKMETDGQKVIEMITGGHEKPVAFFKQMTHHLVNLDLSFLKEATNIILTRNPAEMLPSYAKEVEKPEMKDVGYKQHLELFEYLIEAGNPPIVLDSKRVLTDPKNILRKLCKLIGIPFESSMLRWEKGPRLEDGPWAKHWYHSVHNSTGFKPYKPKSDPFPEHLKPLLEECMPVYEKLKRMSI